MQNYIFYQLIQKHDKGYHPLPIFLQQHRADSKFNSDKSFEYKTMNKSNAVFNKLLESSCAYNKTVQEEADNSPSRQKKSPKLWLY
jgi:hypothetical protein